MLPEAFKKRMKELLADEYVKFEAALTCGTPVRGARINKLKASPEDIASAGLFKLEPLSYCDNGYIMSEDGAIGTHPAHHAGVIYMQDPGAMSSAMALDIDSDAWVIDLCAAPGGKSSQIAERLGDEGFLLSNEFVPKRAKMMVGNFERLGIKNAMVTSLDTAEFKKYFRGAFDLCIADVPCSGEGMFRKSEDSLEMWSEDNVRLCAKRQREIIENATPLIKSGGYLLYSTCTYSLEENEMVIDSFLKEHPEFVLVPVKSELAAATADGICFDGAICESLTLTRRFYPHKNPGEGQFVALMQKRGITDSMSSILYKDSTKTLSKEELTVIDNFFKDNLKERPKGRIVRHGDSIVLIPHSCPILPYSVFSAGVLLGEAKRASFTPAHHFYSAYGRLFKRQVELSCDDTMLKRYLRGEQITADTDNGYCAVTYMGATIGGGKCTGGVINNHYPKGLRNKN